MARRGAPYKKGLDYFPKMTNFYEDPDIEELMYEFGPLGVTIYDAILTIVYSQGYYAKMTEEQLVRAVIRKIGSKWIPRKDAAVQVIHRCVELGLIDSNLLEKGLITSAGIQKRYYHIAIVGMRRQLYDAEYWLLDKEEDEEPLISAPIGHINSEENRINSEENRINSEKKPIEEKENKKKYNKAPHGAKSNKFNNFPQRDYDYDELEKQLLDC